MFVYHRSVDAETKATVQKLPMLTVKAGPRDGDEWIKRIKEEYMALIAVRSPLLWPRCAARVT